MDIAVLGAGNVGGTLGRRWTEAGHAVTFGVRNPAEAKVQALLQQAGPNAKATRLAEAASGAAVVVLTVPWEGARDSISAAGDIAGKVLIDATNPLVMSADGLRQGLVVGHTTSAAEQVAGWAVGARVVKGAIQEQRPTTLNGLPRVRSHARGKVGSCFWMAPKRSTRRAGRTWRTRHTARAV